MDAQERFAALVEELAARPGVEPPGGSRGFGSAALKVDGSIFAMLMAGRLVVKLSAQRVAALIASGGGEPFGTGKRRPMKEWLAVTDEAAWHDLAEEALRFVGRGQR